MQNVDVLFAGGRLPGRGRTDIAVREGVIVALLDEGAPRPAAGKIVELSGALVVPGFVEGHIHLDTSFVGDTWKPHRPCTAGFDVKERVAFQMQLIDEAMPMRERAEAQLRLCLSHGTTHMRSHVMIDGTVGLKHLEAVLPVREKYRDAIDIQLVAFPQSGIIACPGTADLMDAAMAAGCDLVGGLDPATIDRDVEKHLDVVFGIAERRGVDVDIHLHDPHMLGVFQLEQIAARTLALGMQGRVAVSHAYALGEVAPEIARRTGAKLAKAGVSIMTNAPGNHPFPPVALLRAEGVTVFSGNDNIRDAWWPYGDGDMLNRANMVGYRSGFYTDAELEMAFDLVTGAAATALGIARYGMSVGAHADFVALPAEHVPEAVVGVPRRRRTVKRGVELAFDAQA